MLRSRALTLSAQIRRGFSTRMKPLQVLQSRGYYDSRESKTYRKGRELPVVETESSQGWKKRLVAPMAILGIIGAGLYFLHKNDEKRATPVGSNRATENTVNRPAIGGAFRLVDMQNRLVTEADLRGNWVLMYFGYTCSPDVCPAEVQKMAQVIQTLDSAHNLRITPVFITIDPQRDSPVQLRAYLNEFDPRMLGLTGSIAATRQIAHEYRVFFKKVDEESKDDYIVESSNNMYLLDANMEIVKHFGPEYDAVQLTEGIIDEMKKASK